MRNEETPQQGFESIRNGIWWALVIAGAAGNIDRLIAAKDGGYWPLVFVCAVLVLIAVLFLKPGHSIK